MLPRASCACLPGGGSIGKLMGGFGPLCIVHNLATDMQLNAAI